MALSEREQQLLEEMERHLYQSEADVVQPSARRTVNYRSLVLGIIVALVGIGALIGGVAAQQPWLGVVGFIVMLGGVLLAFGRGGSTEASEGAERPGGRSERVAKESLSERMSKRWDQRMDGER